jgi:hypothetical protein
MGPAARCTMYGYRSQLLALKTNTLTKWAHCPRAPTHHPACTRHKPHLPRLPPLPNGTRISDSSLGSSVPDGTQAICPEFHNLVVELKAETPARTLLAVAPHPRAPDPTYTTRRTRSSRLNRFADTQPRKTTELRAPYSSPSRALISPW